MHSVTVNRSVQTRYWQNHQWGIIKMCPRRLFPAKSHDLVQLHPRLFGGTCVKLKYNFLFENPIYTTCQDCSEYYEPEELWQQDFHYIRIGPPPLFNRMCWDCDKRILETWSPAFNCRGCFSSYSIAINELKRDGEITDPTDILRMTCDVKERAILEVKAKPQNLANRLATELQSEITPEMQPPT